jgi:octaheme c-type cytochrome (tetrathionate reductase family)
MKRGRFVWLIGLGVTLLIIAVPILLFTGRTETQAQSPWDAVRTAPQHVDHTSLIKGDLKTGQDVTRVCLTCHEDAAAQVMKTSHFTWVGEPVQFAGRPDPVAIGKANLLNNFCIGVQSNWAGCTKCHAGYGWQDANFDFASAENVDCLVCHEQSGNYLKTTAGNPAEGVDLVSVAQSVGRPTRQNCGGCHFNGGGGDAVKHGDLDSSLYFPSGEVDVHMGRLGFQCVDCHRTDAHQIRGRSISVSVDNKNQLLCTDCHAATAHTDQRINAHTDVVACQSCHVPYTAVRLATKTEWDWSAAGQDRPEDQHEYLKIKGSFVYADKLQPEYAWFNGTVNRYLLGDPLSDLGITVLNPPNGDINDANAKIWPFKIHRAKQPYDVQFNYLLQPMTVGEGGYWTTFDWDSALRAGSAATGIPYSGQFGFAETEMYWTQSHMVPPAKNALQCSDCHGEGTRMNWELLGYPGDPMTWGGRKEASR